MSSIGKLSIKLNKEISFKYNKFEKKYINNTIKNVR